MAEFQEVIKEMRRMCAHFRPTCNGCPLCLEKGTNEFCGEQPLDIRSDPTLVEAAIMQWAAEHPEPEPILWQDFLLDYYCEYIKKQGNETKTVDEWIARDPIPEDIVQKLGIKKETWNTNA